MAPRPTTLIIPVESQARELDGPLASDRMVDALRVPLRGPCTSLRSLAAAGYANWRPPLRSPRAYVKARRKLSKRVAEKAEAAAVPGDRNTQAYHDHRFPGTSVDELHERISRFGAQLGRFEELRVQQIAEHIFRVRRRSAHPASEGP